MAKPHNTRQELIKQRARGNGNVSQWHSEPRPKQSDTYLVEQEYDQQLTHCIGQTQSKDKSADTSQTFLCKAETQS